MNDKRTSRETDVDPGADEDETFLQRWSRRKVEARSGSPDASSSSPSSPDEVADDSVEPTAEPEPLTDADMPPLDELDENSDYSAFLSAGVSPGLRQKALRQLFHSPKFNVIDPLDDYNEDFTQFAPLGNVVTAEMRHRAERLLKKQLEAATEDDAESPPDRGTPEQVAVADDSSEDQDEQDQTGTDAPDKRDNENA